MNITIVIPKTLSELYKSKGFEITCGRPTLAL